MWKNVMSKLKPPAPSDHAIEGAQQVLRNSSSPMLQRLRMIAKLSRILGKDVASTKGRPRLVDTRARPAMQNRKLKLLKKMRTALGKKSKPKKPKNNKLKESKYWKKFAEKKPMQMVCFNLLQDEEEEPEENEPEILISLCTKFVSVSDELVYDFSTGYYEQVVHNDPLQNLLYIPSKIHLKGQKPVVEEEEEDEGVTRGTQKKMEEDDSVYFLDFQQPQHNEESSESEDSELEGLKDDSRRELEELYQGKISKEELAKIDSQPNPFNFSDRVSQTTKIVHKGTGMQTDPPPATRFLVNVSPNDIHHFYMKDQQEKLKRERKRREDDERDRGMHGNKPLDRFTLSIPKTTKTKLGEMCFDLGPLNSVAKVVERMVTQNIFDDILQDFKYWEDGSDEYKPMDGSLLPLWRFKYDNTKSLIVSEITWSPILPDLFAAAYIPCEIGGHEGPGMMCVYNLKNTVTPERVFRAPCGVITVQFHPQIARLMAGGWSDGTVVVYDIQSLSSTPVTSTVVNGKHVLPVTKVRWKTSEPGEDLQFFSVSLDGRVTHWFFHSSQLAFNDFLNFKEKITKSFVGCAPIGLEGSPTCIALCPEDEQVLLVGVNTGVVFQCSTVSSHSVIRYPAHLAPVREVQWNHFHNKVFITCSLDWTVKVWMKNMISPLIVLDMGGPVVGVTWSPYSSSVIVAVTEEFRVNVYDLFIRMCRPLCTQGVLQKRKISGTSVALSPFYPVVIVGGDNGHLIALKLSPNLRKLHKDARAADALTQKEIELAKIERLISLINR
ncbi:LOW QUALITY PROTEIN: dynein intermediate chain 2, ciliary-like [Macrobrachium nipponense]|uniref:LOW QUALITY PROTEIN: dynein intermediate chain 2, ciliary-like n=1 Tax=Macrobrachium nipponense TaxID=159736 RepID=UPI0030C7D93E